MKNILNHIRSLFGEHSSTGNQGRTIEVDHEYIDHKEEKNATLSHESIYIESFFSFFHIAQSNEIEKVVVNQEKSTTVLTSKEDILNYDLLNTNSHSVPGESTFFQIFLKPATKVLEPICISRLNDIGSNFTYFNIYPPHKPSRTTNKNQERVSFRVKTNAKNIRLEQIQAEFSYINETKDASVLELRKNLTEYEWELIQPSDKSVATDYYLGKKFIQAYCFFQSIPLMRNVYESLKNTWYINGLSINEMKLLTETSYWIGHAYVQLKMYDQAYQYLELASRFNHDNFRYKKEFINCLVNSKNLLSILYIDDYLKEYTKEKESAENLDFCNFLLRRKAYLLIEMRLLDEAETILLKLLNIDPDNHFIIKELAHIQEERRKQK